MTKNPVDALQVFPVAIGEYLEHPSLDVDAEVARVVELLSDFAAEPQAWNVPMPDRDGDAVAERLRAWSRSPARCSVLYWVGHGWSDGLRAALAHAASPKAVRSFGVLPEHLADHIDEREGAGPEDGWTIVVIDTCRSSRFVELLNAEVDNKRGPRRILLVGVSGEGSTTLGKFSAALDTVLRDTFRADPQIDLWSLARELDRNLPAGQALARKIGDAVLRRSITPVQAATPLDVRSEVESLLADLTEDERRHFLPKAQGGELGELSWYFEGREAETQRITGWLRDTGGGMFVVTGPAGAGKSALLGNLVMQSHPALRAALAQHGFANQPWSPDNPHLTFDAVLHLTGLTPLEATLHLADALGPLASGRIPEPGADLIDTTLEDDSSVRDIAGTLSDELVGQQVDALIAQLHDEPTTILVDALDEAVSPLSFARGVLRPLAELSNVRLVVGTRRSTREGPDEPDPQDHDLLEALGADDDSTLFLDRDPAAITRYVHRRLTVAADTGAIPRVVDVPGTGERAVGPEDLRRAAEVIGASERQFLFARLAVHEIIAEPALLRGPQLDVLARDDHRQLFRRALDRLAGQRPANGALLDALARSHGRGIPLRDGVWATIAGAVDPAVRVGDVDIGALLVAAAPYIMLDREHGQSVYRLAHRTFIEHLRLDADDTELNTRIVADLIDTAPDDDINPYVTHYLSAHAGDAGPPGWQLLAENLHTWDRLDPMAVGSDVMRTAFGRHQLPSEIIGVVGARHLLNRAELGDRPGIRQLAMARHAGRYRDGLATADPGAGRWSLRWANIEPQTMHITLTGHVAPISCMTAVPRQDGSIWLATGSEDHTVRIWDPSSATSIGRPMLTGAGPVRAVTTVALRGTPSLVAIGEDRAVTLWDPDSGEQVDRIVLVDGETRQPFGSIRALSTCSLPGDVPAVIIGDRRGHIYFWRPLSGEVDQVSSGHVGAITAIVPLTEPNGRALLAVSALDGTVSVIDLHTRDIVGRLFAEPVAPTLALAVVPGRGRPALATAGGDDTVRIWGLDTLLERPRTQLWRRGRPLRGHTGRLSALTMIPPSPPDTTSTLASAAQDGTIRIWAVAGSGKTIESDPPLRGHVGPVWALAALPLSDGRTLLASGGQDGTVRLWDPRAGSVTDRTAGHRGAVNTVTPLGGAAQPGTWSRVFATGGEDGTVRWWHADTGVQTQRPGTRHAGPLTAATCLRSGDHPVLATVADDGTVRLWHPPERPWRWQSGRPLTRRRDDWVWTVATVAYRDRPSVLATAGIGSSVRLWRSTWRDWLRARPFGRPLIGQSYGIGTLAALPTADGCAMLASVDEVGRIVFWRVPNAALPTSNWWPRPLPHPMKQDRLSRAARMTALAVLQESDGRPLLAGGRADGQMTFWDPDTAEQLGVTMPGHAGPVHTIIPIPPSSGRPLLATAAAGDATLQIWDPTTRTRLSTVNLATPIRALCALSHDELVVGTNEGVAVVALPADA